MIHALKMVLGRATLSTENKNALGIPQAAYSKARDDLLVAENCSLRGQNPRYLG